VTTTSAEASTSGVSRFEYAPSRSIPISRIASATPGSTAVRRPPVPAEWTSSRPAASAPLEASTIW
jgi:hypothetical protein